MALDDHGRRARDNDNDDASMSGHTVRSLRTDSSLTVCAPEDGQERYKQPLEVQSRLRRMSVRGLQAALRDVESSLAKAQSPDEIPTHVYEDLLELHRFVSWNVPPKKDIPN